jgi:hypothetical protein
MVVSSRAVQAPTVTRQLTKLLCEWIEQLREMWYN